MAVGMLRPVAAAAYAHAGNDGAGNDGKPRWSGRSVTYRYNAQVGPGLPNVEPGSDPRAAVDAAFAEWAGACDHASVRGGDSAAREGGVNDGVNLITFAATEDNASRLGGALAVTIFWIDSSNRILDADVIFGAEVPWSTVGTPGDFSVRGVATHEVGHFHGLAHSAIMAATMWPYAARNGSVGESDTLADDLAHDDRAGVNVLYPLDALAADTGTISGTVTLDGARVFGAHVVAMDTRHGIAEAAAITLGSNQDAAFGTYEIRGLPPGPYRLLVEPLDGPATSANWPGNPRDGDYWGGVFASFATTYLGGNGAPDVVVVTPGGGLLANVAMSTSARTLNPTAIGFATPGGGFGATNVAVQLAAGDVRHVAVVGTGLHLVATGDIACSDPDVLVDDRLPAPPNLALLRVTVPASAPPGPRSLLFRLPATGEVAALVGCLDVTPATFELSCTDGVDNDLDGRTDCRGEGDAACPCGPEDLAAANCGDGVDNDDDGLADGLDAACDACPLDEAKVDPGACGCGVPEADVDGDAVPDCADNCTLAPNPEQGDWNANGIGDGCDCLPGDIEPDGRGDGDVDLADVVLAKRKTLEVVAKNPHDVACGDIHPGAVTCATAVGPDHWCVAGDGGFELADLVVLRRLVLLALRPGCAACAGRSAEIPGSRLPGDVTPLQGDGRVDVADVVLALRWCVGLSAPTAESLLRADVAPGGPEEGVTVAVGDGRIDVADVVRLLRAAVGRDTISWPERTAVVRLGASGPLAGVVVSVSAWPPWAALSGVSALACAPDALEADAGAWAFACIPDHEPIMGPADLVAIRYRAPEAVVARELVVSAAGVDPNLEAVAINASLRAGAILDNASPTPSP
jgi:hypothetical protein